ncbi:MAG TPA: hypothetical protein VFV10_16580 [Gammaproteobacteria bacterium]|nr:hypothetical protein [Gammaproteobacteria bacterium]
MRRAVTVAVLFAALLAAARACADEDEDVVVTSPRADAVSVTIYRDDLALVTETRTVDLPAGPFTLVLEDVVETLLPQSAVLNGADRTLAESNFDFDRLTPASLLERSIGKTVTIVRTNPKTGRVMRMPATILAAGDGIVLRTPDGSEALHCSGLPERLELSEVPQSLLAKPRLSVRLAAGAPGKRTLTVSYLAHGFSWSSDYVARLNARSDRLALRGWITLTNSTGTSFAEAQVQIVAGRLNLVDASDGGSRGDAATARDGGDGAADARRERDADAARDAFALLTQCRESTPPPATLDQRLREGKHFYAPSIEEVVVTGARIARREALGDYQLYRLPIATDLAARQTKQVAFLDKPAVKVERFYNYELDDLDATGADEDVIPTLTLAFQNRAGDGLGEPLPSGRVRVFEPYEEREVFAGGADLADKPVGSAVELEIGGALNLAARVTAALDGDARGDGLERVTVTVEHRVMNDKREPVAVEVRHRVSDRFTSLEVRKSSPRAQRKNGELVWRIKVPAGGEASVSYVLTALERP